MALVSLPSVALSSDIGKALMSCDLPKILVIYCSQNDLGIYGFLVSL